MWLVYGSLLILALLAHMLLCLVVSHNAPSPTIRNHTEDHEEEEKQVSEAQNEVSEQSALIPVSKPTSPSLNTTDRLSDDGWEALEALDSQV
jgi:hypothetical protein